MSKKKEFLIETDILVDHLTKKDNGGLSALETAMRTGTCFTTMLNASELYYAAQNETEQSAVDNVTYSLKVLGLHSRYSLSISKYGGKTGSVREAIICAVAVNNKLPILSKMGSKYKDADVSVIHPDDLTSL